jgi:glutaminase
LRDGADGVAGRTRSPRGAPRTPGRKLAVPEDGKNRHFLAQALQGLVVDFIRAPDPVQSPIQSYLESLHRSLAPLCAGEVASYIPELLKTDPESFGICLVTADGVLYGTGDVAQPFTIQSISKAFVYAAGLADRGKDYVARRIGVEPSGDAFNSISLDPQSGAPFNPMINAGAIAAASIVGGDTPAAQWHRIESALAAFAGRPLALDEAVYRSESETGHRNRAIAWMLKNFGIIDGDPMAAVENYFRQCSLLVDCRDLAYMAATLANGGVHPVTGVRAMPADHVERVLSVMATCGMYDYAGSWMYEVGMPAKSGVGGGILAVLPGRFGIGVFSPRLDAKGNSARGIEVCKRMSRDFGLNIFSSVGTPRMALGRVFTGTDAPSRRARSPRASAWLKERSHRIKFLSLHGYLAVDGIEFVIRRMQELAPETDCFVLDMHRVDGVSESAAKLVNQARVAFAADNVAIVFSRIQGGAAITGPLRKALARDDRGVLSFEDNDLAGEWCENRLLEALDREPEAAGAFAETSLLRGLEPDLLREVEAASCVRDYAAGESILVCGQAGDDRIFFVETGQVSVLLPLDDGMHQRIATLGPGMVFGEMVLLGQTTRSASVYADTAVRCRILGSGDLERLSDGNPRIKITLLANLARDLAGKLRGANRWIAALA